MAARHPAPVATIDVGTNTALLLVSSWEKDRLVMLHDETRFVRLGEGVDASGIVGEPAMMRLKDTLNYYKQVVRRWRVSEIIVGATSASRDAANKRVLIDFVKRETGLDYSILTGEEEAQWSFEGVGAGLHGSDFEEILTVDIGGGSTEFTLGGLHEGRYEIDLARSLNVGSVRLKEKFFPTLPPEERMIAEARRWLLEQLALLPPAYRSNGGALIGASGTTNVLAMLEAGDTPVRLKKKSMLGSIPNGRVRKRCAELLSMNEDEVLGLNPVLMKGREDVFPAGLLILESLMTFLEKEIIHVNSWGLRHGLALRYWRSLRPV